MVTYTKENPDPPPPTLLEVKRRGGEAGRDSSRKAPRRPGNGRCVVGEITADPDDGGHPLPRNGCRGAKPPLTPFTRSGLDADEWTTTRTAAAPSETCEHTRDGPDGVTAPPD